MSAGLLGTRHQCPIPRCAAQVQAQNLMCAPHWRMVGAPLQRAVYSAWAGGWGAGSPGHRRAREAAISAVERRLEAAA